MLELGTFDVSITYIFNYILAHCLLARGRETKNREKGSVTLDK